MPDHTPWHIVVVAGLVRNAQGQVLMIDSPRRGWEFPGGQVEEGESLTHALGREILEETGISVSIGALAAVYSSVHLPSKVVFGFLCEAIGGETRTSSESKAVEWVASDQVLARITRPSIRDRMRDLLEFGGHVIYRVYSIDPVDPLSSYVVQEERFLE